jgi:hypothetical protein
MPVVGSPYEIRSISAKFLASLMLRWRSDESASLFRWRWALLWGQGLSNPIRTIVCYFAKEFRSLNKERTHKRTYEEQSILPCSGFALCITWKGFLSSRDGLPPPPLILTYCNKVCSPGPQSVSSDPSLQSCLPSHTKPGLIHSPLLHLNSRFQHFLWAETQIC